LGKGIRELLQQLSDRLKITLNALPQCGVMERCGWVVQRKDGEAAHLSGPGPHFADALIGEPLDQRMLAQGNDNLRLNECDLLLKIMATRGDLTMERVSVVRRTTLYHVGDEYILPLEPYRSEQLVEELARRPYKRLTLPIFMKTRAFAHEHNPGFGRALSGHGLGALLVQRASSARADLLVQLVERCY
jgi:hypothetical protein